MITFARITSQIESPTDAALFARLLVWAHTLSVCKHVVVLPTLVRVMRRRPVDQATDEPLNDRECERIATLARWACELVPWRRRQGDCLERSLLTYRYLSRSRTDLSLVVGFSATDATPSRGHAWVQLGRRPIGEDGASIAPFTRLLAFDTAGQLVEEESRPAV